MKLISYSRCVAAIAVLVAASAHAQLRVEISGVGSNQIPVAISSFAGDDQNAVQISKIVQDDLARSGYFKLIPASATLSDTAQVNFDDWRGRGAQALAVGSVQKLSDGRFDARYRLYDTVKSANISGFAMPPVSNPRLIAHKIADDIYEKLLGVPGVFSTRIAYVTKAGKEYRIEVADADGEGTQVAFRSTEPVISPAWSPDGSKLAYVSFEAKKPVVYVQNLVTRQRTVIANYKGSNSAPAWSPDGSKLAISLSRDGSTQIYTVNADGSGLQRISNTGGIDTEPQFAADGQHIYFLSDRSGGPQIYRMSTSGGDVKRVTFSGSYNITPRISPDGKTLAYISRRDGKFQLFVLDLANGQELRLSDTTKDESPSFSPNGRYIMYATESGGRGTLAVASVDGRIKQKITVQAGDIREPTWGPFMK